MKITGVGIALVIAYYTLVEIDYEELTLRSALNDCLVNEGSDFETIDPLNNYLNNKKKLYKVENSVSPFNRLRLKK